MLPFTGFGTNCRETPDREEEVMRLTGRGVRQVLEVSGGAGALTKSINSEAYADLENSAHFGKLVIRLA